MKWLGLPAEAVAAIDRYWKPVWDDAASSSPRTAGAGRSSSSRRSRSSSRARSGRRGSRRCGRRYRAWYLREGEAARPDLATCRQALARHMPELVPAYERLVELAGGDELAARMLTLYRPPGFVVGCSQGAWTRGEPVLVRNYDYPADAARGDRLPDGVDRAAACSG